MTKRPDGKQHKLLKSGKLKTQTVVSLLGLASDCGFVELDDLYDAFPPRRTERPTTTITVALGKRSKTVEMRPGRASQPPVALRHFADALAKVARP